MKGRFYRDTSSHNQLVSVHGSTFCEIFEIWVILASWCNFKESFLIFIYKFIYKWWWFWAMTFLHEILTYCVGKETERILRMIGLDWEVKLNSWALCVDEVKLNSWAPSVRELVDSFSSFLKRNSSLMNATTFITFMISNLQKHYFYSESKWQDYEFLFLICGTWSEF